MPDREGSETIRAQCHDGRPVPIIVISGGSEPI